MISKKDGNLEIGEFLELQYNVFFFIYLILEFFFLFLKLYLIIMIFIRMNFFLYMTIIGE